MTICLRGLPGDSASSFDAPLFGLASDGVFLASRITPAAGGLLPHRFTLTISGGLFSVALSVGSPRPGLHRASRSMKSGLSSRGFPPAVIRPTRNA